MNVTIQDVYAEMQPGFFFFFFALRESLELHKKKSDISPFSEHRIWLRKFLDIIKLGCLCELKSLSCLIRS